MSNFLNRLKNLKGGSSPSHNNESDTGSICSFDEEGFLCPICRRKFADTTALEHHYLHAHSHTQPTTIHEDTNGISNSSKHAIADDPVQEAAVWKQQFCVSEESRMKLSSEIMHQRQRVSDLEEEIELLHKQLRNTQLKVVEQSQEIGNLKANKDIYDAQIAMFTDELLQTQGELKQKQSQVDILCNDLIPRPTNDDVDVLKRELISVQQRMNDMSLEKEEEIEKLRSIIKEIYEYAKKCENMFDQNVLIYDKEINNYASQIQHDITQIKEFIQATRRQKEKFVNNFYVLRKCLNDNKTEIDRLKETNAQLNMDLGNQNQLNDQLKHNLENEQKQTNSYRTQIENLTNEIQTLEKALDELKQEKNHLLLTKMDNDDNEQERDLVRQLIQDKDEYEQQIKELRKQNKQILEEKENIQHESDHMSTQLTQINHENVELNNQINTLKQQLDDLNNDKERQLNELNQELSRRREEYSNTNSKLENDLRESNENHKQELERSENNFQTQLTEQISKSEIQINELRQTLNQQEEILNTTKSNLDNLQKEKDEQEKLLGNNQQTIDDLQLKVSQLSTDLNQKNELIKRLTVAIRQRINQLHQAQEYIEENIHTTQVNILTLIEQSEQESQEIRKKTLEDIHYEFMNYLTVVNTIINDNKNKLAKQNELQQNVEKQLNKLNNEHNQIIKEYNEEKQKFEMQINELHNSLLKVSESLTEVTHTADFQREKYENQITSLEEEVNNANSELESRTKKYEMQLSALTENLATVRGELKTTQEKLFSFEIIKNEKADLQERLTAMKEENQSLLERSVVNEARNEKLLLENGQLAKKNSDLESALQEIAREYQGLQIYTNKISQRRWLNDSDVHQCMKCNQTFTLTQRKHHCRNCGNIFCDTCSTKTAVVAASSKKPQRVCDQCFKELTS